MSWRAPSVLASVTGAEAMVPALESGAALRCRAYHLWRSTEGNPALTSLGGLSGLSGSGGLWIADNSALTSLHGLVQHTSIGDGPYLKNNDALTQLDGLENLIELGASLEVVDNDSLLNLRGFGRLATATGCDGRRPFEIAKHGDVASPL